MGTIETDVVVKPKRGERPQNFKTDEEWEKSKERRRKDYYKHKEKRNKQTKIWRERVKDTEEYKIKKRLSDKNYNLKNKDILSEKNKEYRLKNIDILKEKSMIYYQNHKEEAKQYKIIYNIINKDEIKEKRKKYYLNNKNKLKEKQKQRRIFEKDKVNISIENANNKKKILAMNILGGSVCMHCGNTDFRVLQFDHINGGGRFEKKKNKGGYMGIVRRIVKNPTQAKLTYQVLCANCNTIKVLEEKEHPYISNPTDVQLKRRIVQQKHTQKLKLEAMNALGGVACKTCGNVDIRCLQVDHIHGGGGKELVKLKTSGVYKKIRDDPSCRYNYQVLCANCNMIKRVVNHEGKGKQKNLKSTI